MRTPEWVNKWYDPSFDGNVRSARHFWLEGEDSGAGQQVGNVDGPDYRRHPIDSEPAAAGSGANTRLLLRIYPTARVYPWRARRMRSLSGTEGLDT